MKLCFIQLTNPRACALGLLVPDATKYRFEGRIPVLKSDKGKSKTIDHSIHK